MRLSVFGCHIIINNDTIFVQKQTTCAIILIVYLIMIIPLEYVFELYNG